MGYNRIHTTLFYVLEHCPDDGEYNMAPRSCSVLFRGINGTHRSNSYSNNVTGGAGECWQINYGPATAEVVFGTVCVEDKRDLRSTKNYII